METTVDEQEEYSAEATATEVSFKVTLPSRDNKDAVAELLSSLEWQREKRGVTTLCKWLSKYQMHERLANDMWENAVNTANYVNGVRSIGQQKGDKKRSLRSDAQDFYDNMTTPMLRMHCKLFDIDYDAAVSVEEVVEMLVQKHVDMIAA